MHLHFKIIAMKKALLLNHRKSSLTFSENPKKEITRKKYQKTYSSLHNNISTKLTIIFIQLSKERYTKTRNRHTCSKHQISIICNFDQNTSFMKVVQRTSITCQTFRKIQRCDCSKCLKLQPNFQFRIKSDSHVWSFKPPNFCSQTYTLPS